MDFNEISVTMERVVIKEVDFMSEEKIQLQNVNHLETLENLDFSGGYACDMETGICGPIDEQNQTTKTEEEKKNANNDMV